MTGYIVTRRACVLALMTIVPACAAVRIEQSDTLSGGPPNKGNFMLNPLTASSHPSPPQVVPIEHAGVRYEQDTARQSQPDLMRGGWLVAKDTASDQRLWSVELYANPYDAASPIGSPPRWFRRMQLTTDGTAIEIEDDIGTHFVVNIATHAVTVRQSSLLNPTTRAEDRRPKFD